MYDKLFYSAWKMCFIFLGLFLSFTVFAQTKKTGKVLSFDDKSPVIGASLGIKGSSLGTVTDVNGNFTLTLKATDVLVVSYIGYDTQELTVGDAATLVISLHPASRSLNEV